MECNIIIWEDTRLWQPELKRTNTSILNRVDPKTGLVTCKVVTFYSVADADAVTTSMAYKIWHERPMRMMPYEADDAKRETSVGNLFVWKTSLKHYVRGNSLKHVQHLAVSWEWELSDEHGVSCGFAYVHFEQEGNAKTAMANLHNANFKPI